MSVTQYRVLPGPEAFLPPAAASMGIVLPDPGQGHINGVIATEDETLEEAARVLLKAKVPTIFPGPLVLWNWNENAAKKATAIRKLYETMKETCREGAKPLLIPMADYRPKYPKIDPEIEINPNHPNLTIWHNKIDACIFVGVHCHQANLSLKIIRGGTNCYTIAFCAQAGHEDANASIRDLSPEKIYKFIDIFKRVAGEMGIRGNGAAKR